MCFSLLVSLTIPLQSLQQNSSRTAPLVARLLTAAALPRWEGYLVPLFLSDQQNSVETLSSSVSDACSCTLHMRNLIPSLSLYTSLSVAAAAALRATCVLFQGDFVVFNSLAVPLVSTHKLVPNSSSSNFDSSVALVCRSPSLKPHVLHLHLATSPVLGIVQSKHVKIP